MPKKIQFSEEVIQTALFAKALSHPVRVFILKKLSKLGTCCYSGDLVEELPIPYQYTMGYIFNLRIGSHRNCLADHQLASFKSSMEQPDKNIKKRIIRYLSL